MSGTSHWQQVYGEREPDEVSWYEAKPEASLRLVAATGVAGDAAIIDVGGGASALASELVDAGYEDVTVVDLSRAALEAAQNAAGPTADKISWTVGDVREHDFRRQFDLWHDRAVFHFMVESSDREAYLATLRRTLRPGGHLIIATFGPDGPTSCSGLSVRNYGADDLSAMLGAEFEYQGHELVAHATPSGNQQQFLYARFRRGI